MKNYLDIINQIFEINQKLIIEKSEVKYSRNFDKIFNLLEEDGYKISNPIGETFSETRTDLEASLIGNGTKRIITRVFKPIIYFKNDEGIVLVQKGIVVAE